MLLDKSSFLSRIAPCKALHLAVQSSNWEANGFGSEFPMFAAWHIASSIDLCSEGTCCSSVRRFDNNSRASAALRGAVQVRVARSKRETAEVDSSNNEVSCLSFYKKKPFNIHNMRLLNKVFLPLHSVQTS